MYISTYNQDPGCRAFGRHPAPYESRPTFSDSLAVFFSSFLFWRLPATFFGSFGSPSACFPFIFDVFLVPFTAPGAHARMVLPLQRELDPEGLGRSENRCFFDVFFRVEEKGYPSVSFSAFLRCYEA